VLPRHPDLPEGWFDRRHLRRLNRIWTNDPIFFITTCQRHWRPILHRPPLVHAILECLAEARERCGWLIGAYVVMPDHVHFLCRPVGEVETLNDFLARFKSRATRSWWSVGGTGRLWQRESFEHLLRSNEAYGEIREYIRQNPVEAGLCAQPEEWPYVGDMDAF